MPVGRTACLMMGVVKVGALTAAIALAAVLVGQADEKSARTFSGAPLDEILDANVRDGLVYYRMLRANWTSLQAYVESLGSVSLESASKDEQIAFWLNAYNAIVLDTVSRHYPIAATTSRYPARSIRQIAGAFDVMTHRVAGRHLTLDQIEQTMLGAFQDPRLYFALGRGAVGGGRLRSEAFTADRLDQQLAEAASECVSRSQCLQIVRADNRLRVSAIFSWRRAEFVDRYSSHPIAPSARRTPIERAIVAFISPALLDAERQFLAANVFKVEYLPFDWSLNDLTGRSSARNRQGR